MEVSQVGPPLTDPPGQRLRRRATGARGVPTQVRIDKVCEFARDLGGGWVSGDEEKFETPPQPANQFPHQHFGAALLHQGILKGQNDAHSLGQAFPEKV